MRNGYAFAVLSAEEDRVRSTRPGERNNVLFWAAVRLGGLIAAEQISRSLVVGRLTDAARICGLGDLEIDGTLTSGISRGESKPHRSPRRIVDRATALKEIDRIERIICDRAWPGDQGRLTYLTLRSVVSLARTFGGPGELPLAVRRVAAEMGGHKNRARDGLQLARKGGWLRIVKDATSTRPAIYDLRVPPALAAQANIKSAAPVPVGGILNQAGPSHDAFRALGDIGLISLDHLDRRGDWLSRQDLSAETGIPMSTLYKHLSPRSPLVAQNLVETRPRSVRAVPTLSVEDLDRVAASLGTTGANERRLRGIAREYRALGRIDADGNWRDITTGQTLGDKPTWLGEVSSDAA